MKNFFGLLTSLIFFYLAYDIYATGTYPAYINYAVKLGIYKNLVVTIFLSLASFILYRTYLNYQSKGELDKGIEYSKCPKCKRLYTYYKLKDGICSKCGIKTIDLEIYFDKYPEDK